MKHLLTFIISLAVVSLAFVALPHECQRNNSTTVIDTTSELHYSIPNFKEVQRTVAEITQPENRDWEHYYGDTLVCYGDNVVYISFGGETGTEEVSSIDQAMFITVKDSVPVDTCVIVDMHNGVWAKGETIYVMFGVDTMRFDARKLPHEINMMDRYATGKGWKNHSYKRSFALSDSSWNCDFYFQSYLPKDVPNWTKKFMGTIISNDITALYLDNKGADKILNEYYGVETTAKQIKGINTSKSTPKQIAAHYAREHERLYREEFDEVDENAIKHGPKYDYLFKMNPAWKSRDGKYITYRFYTFYYAMGMHGFMEEYYLTFESKTGRLLGVEDLFKTGKFKDAVQILEKKINDYKHEYMDADIHFTADLDESSLESNSSAIIKEKAGGKIYPRPAMTSNGVVFTYQPYEIGAFTEGVIHFTVPYNQINNYLRIKR